MSVVVIIPTLNEAQGIGSTIKEVMESFDDLEVVVVDANSVDGTSHIAACLGAKIIRQHGLGKGRAISQTLQCINPNIRYLVIIDGDYTYPARYIPQMIKILEENPDVGMVTGQRLGNPKKFVTHFKHLITNYYYLGNHILKLAHRMLNGVKMKDPLTGLRAIRFSLIKDLKIKARDFDVEVELNKYIQRRGKVIEIHIEYRPRLGNKKLQIKHGLTIFKRMIIMTLENIS